MDVLVDEAKSLAAAGVKELVIVAEDTTAYGLDIDRKRHIHTLLEKLADVDGIQWIRLMYAYPHTVLPELTTFLREHEKAVKYLDIPIQHISSPMLKSMLTSSAHRRREVFGFFFSRSRCSRDGIWSTHDRPCPKPKRVLTYLLQGKP